MLATVIRSEPDRSSPAAHTYSLASLAALDRIGTIVTARSGETLFHAGDEARHYFKVQTGTVRTCRLLAGGKRHVGAFFLEGDYLGLVSDDKYRCSAEAVTDTKLVKYSRSAVGRLVDQHSGLRRRLIDLVSAELSGAQTQMMLLGRKTAVERLASFLLAMAERQGDGDRISLPMTRTDIADHLGLSTETVSRTFTEIKTRGLIRLVGLDGVTVRNRAALEDLADAASA
jgi:CRP/FNR family transcriptional regulator, anaerobic regulatory protein